MRMFWLSCVKGGRDVGYVILAIVTWTLSKLFSGNLFSFSFSFLSFPKGSAANIFSSPFEKLGEKYFALVEIFIPCRYFSFFLFSLVMLGFMIFTLQGDVPNSMLVYCTLD